MKKSITLMFKKISFLLIIVLTLISGCKKYEEGPSISLRSKKSRVAGDWNVVSYSLGNACWSDKIYKKESVGCQAGGFVECFTFECVNSFTMQFDKDGNYSWNRNTTISRVSRSNTIYSCTACYDTNTNIEAYSGTWCFNPDKKKLIITNFIFSPFYLPDNSEYTYSRDDPSTVEWEIIELRENHMKLKHYEYAMDYQLVLEKK